MFLLLIAHVTCDYLNEVFINAEVNKDDSFESVNDFDIEVKLKNGSGNIISHYNLNPIESNELSVSKVLSNWIGESYSITEDEADSAIIKIRYKAKDNLEKIEKEIICDSKSKEESVDFSINSGLATTILFKVSVLFKSYTTIDPFPQPSTMSGDITLPAAVLLRNDGCGYVIDTPLKITKAHRRGNLYLPPGTKQQMSDTPDGYKEDEFINAKHSKEVDIEANKEFYPVIDSLSDLLINIKSIIRVDPPDDDEYEGFVDPEYSGYTLNIYDTFSLTNGGLYTVYTNSIDRRNFMSFTPNTDTKILLQISDTIKQRYAANASPIKYNMQIKRIGKPFEYDNIEINVADVSTYKDVGVHVKKSGPFEIRYSVIPVEAVYTIIEGSGTHKIKKVLHDTFIRGGTNDFTIPPTFQFTQSKIFMPKMTPTMTAKPTQHPISNNTKHDLPMYGLFIIFAGLIIIIIIAIVIALCCCFKHKCGKKVEEEEEINKEGEDNDENENEDENNKIESL